MSVIKEINKYHDEMTAWRRDIHMHPELAYEETRTSDFVAEKLKEFGMEVHQGLAKTGVVGTIRNGDGPSIGLRADLDALPLEEKNTFEHASVNLGKMHACGHDGHITMLVQEGLFDKFPVDSVYGMHNWTGLEAGYFGIGAGPIMAAADTFDLIIQGQGGHAAMPYQCVDPIIAASQVVNALQTIPSRNTHPVDSVIISVTQIHAGDAYNIIPDTVRMHGSVRTFLPETRNEIPSRILKVSEGVCAALGASCELNFINGYPATVNSVPETDISAKAAIDLVGEDKVVRNPTPSMASEDFSYMLEARPGCYVWLGIGPGEGEHGCTLHSPHYDFNDEVLPTGAAYWATLVENELATG